MEPLLEKDSHHIEKGKASFAKISFKSYDSEHNSISTQCTQPYFRKYNGNNMQDSLKDSTENTSTSPFNGGSKIKDYNYTCYKYVILVLGILTAIFTIESMRHFLEYFTPFYTHLISLGFRGWDIFQLFKLSSAMQRKDILALEGAIFSVKWFIAIYSLVSICLFLFSSRVIIYLTGYLATAAYVDGEAIPFKSHVLFVIIAEISLYGLILCGGYGIKAVLLRYEEARKEEEDTFHNHT